MLLLAWLAGCGADGSDTIDLSMQVEGSPVIPTVLTATWTLDPPPEAAWVVATPQEDGLPTLRVAVALDDEPPWSTPILGLRPGSSVQVEVQVQVEGEVRASPPVQAEVGAAPSDLPDFEVEAPAPDQVAFGYLLTTLLTPPTALVLDDQGRVLWWYRYSGVELLSRARLSADGASVLLGSLDTATGEESALLRVSLDGTEEEWIPTPYRHHDFVEHEDGTLAWLALDPREVEGVQVAGDAIVERDPDGSTRQVYSVWDHHEAWAGQVEDNAFPGTAGGDWPHGNALDWLPQEQAYRVSFLRLGGIALVDRPTGAERWFLGGSESTLHDAWGQAAWFNGQHGMDSAGDDLLVFVNGPGTRGASLVELRLDPDAGRADELWSYVPEPAVASPALGDVQRLDSDYVLATFSYAGEVHQVDAAGDLQWRLQAGLGGALGYLQALDRLQAEPEAASQRAVVATPSR